MALIVQFLSVNLDSLYPFLRDSGATPPTARAADPNGDDPDPDPTPEKNLIHDPTLEIKTGSGIDIMKFIPNDKKLLKKVCIF